MLQQLAVTVDTSKPPVQLRDDIRDAIKDLADRTSDGDGREPVVVPYYPVAVPRATNFQDVQAFHEKFAVPQAPQPAWLDVAATDFRAKFLQEELNEFGEAYADGDMVKAFDALMDLAYVAFGTAAMMGLPWQQGWELVQQANMSKVRAQADGSDSKRGSALDVVKPVGFVPADVGIALLLGVTKDTVFPTMLSDGSLQYPHQQFLPTEGQLVAEQEALGHSTPVDSEGGSTD